MQFIYEPITSAEADAQRAIYEPLTKAVRDLLDATIRTEADASVVAQATRAIEEATEDLQAKQIDGPFGVRFTVEGKGHSWGNPVVGLRNPIAPPLIIERTSERCWTEFELGAAYEGPPNHVHGGMSALILDHILGEAASAGLTKPLFTGTITLKYLRGTPLGRLRSEAWIDRVDGIKTYAKGFIADSEGPTVEAEGVFIQPVWARD
ncbi:MAG TPA: PaaI family thioesterase [Mycobacterium sp.]|nr:PaaI family thioesterase [Mycobacterium sp.]